MELLGILFVPLILLMVVVAPIWIIAHYLTRWRLAKSLSDSDEQLLSDLRLLADRLDERVQIVEKILDAESTHWRK
jgi:phage shock protein B